MKPRSRKWLRFSLLGFALLAAVVYLLFRLTPWPSTLLVRYAFNKEAVRVNQALEKRVPTGVQARYSQHYDEADDDAFLDVYNPPGNKAPRPLVLWIHGGGLVSGSKEQVANYCRLLASSGYTVAAMDYTLAPEGKYPTPVRQANKALAFLVRRAADYGIDTSLIVLAGDSGGAQIAAQTANLLVDSSYARLVKVEPGIRAGLLKGLLLFCGIYDISQPKSEGDFGAFLNTILWAYSGSKNWAANSHFQTVSVARYLHPSFPPVFVSAGNGDPLLQQSLQLARQLAELGVRTDTLFFPASLQPALPHEYQFNLETVQGREAFARSLQFLASFRQSN